MKKIIMTGTILAIAATQSFGANTAFLTKVVAKMTDDIMAIKAENVYLKDEIKKLSKQNYDLEKKIVYIEKAVKDSSKENSGLLEKITKLESNDKELSTKIEGTKKEVESKIEKFGSTIAATKSDDKTKMLEEKLNVIESKIKSSQTNQVEDVEEIDPEVEKRILEYINSK